MQTELRTRRLVDTDAELADVARGLAGGDTYYLDTEFESARGGSTLSVVQVSRGSEVHLIDALRLRRLGPLGRAIGRPGATWVLHAGREDVQLLCDRLELDEAPRLFDTQIAWALIGPEASVSLAYLVYRVLGLRTMKPHQADDWMRRPLPASQLEYAAGDVTHLPALHGALVAEVRARRREAAVFDAGREQLVPASEAPEPALSLASFRNAWQLDARSQAALLFLIEHQRAESDPRGALGTKTLLAIASRLPGSTADLARIKGVPGGWARRHGAEVVAGLRKAAEGATTEGFEPIEPPPYATWEEIRREGWLAFARSEVSARAHVAPELAFTGRVMRAMRQALADDGRRESAARALEGWRENVLGGPYLALCAEFPG